MSWNVVCYYQVACWNMDEYLLLCYLTRTYKLYRIHNLKIHDTMTIYCGIQRALLVDMIASLNVLSREWLFIVRCTEEGRSGSPFDTTVQEMTIYCEM